MSVRFWVAVWIAAATSTVTGSAVGRSVGTMRVSQLAGSLLVNMARLRVSSASETAASAAMTPASRLATSDWAATTSRGAMVPTRTLMRFSSRSCWARPRLLRCASRLSSA